MYAMAKESAPCALGRIIISFRARSRRLSTRCSRSLSLARLAARLSVRTHPSGRPRIPSYPAALLPPAVARAPADDVPPLALRVASDQRSFNRTMA
jgi:hypothetical protein